ncbi:MAG: ferrous iron transporter [Burkholderiales bacterium]|jgi:ferrous iron transport protein B|nr:ferrous iron transporter [Burkholderiales bacterium]
MQSQGNNSESLKPKNIKIALVGNPNCGKTALFNALTGSRQRVANYAGVTVEKKHGYFITPKQNNCTLIDLPGTYSLRSRSPDEKITRDVVFGEFNDEAKIDLILCILDATNLSNGLRLVLELQRSNHTIIVALNMMDIAKRKGYEYDLLLLEQELGCKVIPTTAIKKIGITQLVNTIDEILPLLAKKVNLWHEPSVSNTREFHAKVSQILKKVELGESLPPKISDRIDHVLLHPVAGLLILFIVLFLLFQSVFTWAVIPQNAMQDAATRLQEYVVNLAPGSLLSSLLGNGIIAGVSAVIVFLPQILTISLFIILLEDSGYMARAAFLMDKLMGGAGLHGRAFIPLLSSFACAIPGIMATRVIENRRDRLVTILISPLMTCSARLPIYTLLISAFIPAKRVMGWINLQGLVMFGLYFIGIVFALLVAFIFKHFFFKGERQPSMIELPSYKLPMPQNVLIELIKPAKNFLKRAGTIILAIMIILWFLSTFPLPPAHATDPVINYSFVGIIGKFLAPLFAPIGFSWQIVAALIPGMAAREVAVSALGTIYALSGSEEAIKQSLSTTIAHSWTIATGLSLIAWYAFAPQCISTLAVAKRETNSWKWPVVMFSYQMVLAYIMSFIVYRIALAI